MCAFKLQVHSKLKVQPTCQYVFGRTAHSCRAWSAVSSRWNLACRSNVIWALFWMLTSHYFITCTAVLSKTCINSRLGVYLSEVLGILLFYSTVILLNIFIEFIRKSHYRHKCLFFAIFCILIYICFLYVASNRPIANDDEYDWSLLS